MEQDAMFVALVTVALDRHYGGPFARETYRQVLLALSDATSSLLEPDIEPAREAEVPEMLVEIFEDVSRQASSLTALPGCGSSAGIPGIDSFYDPTQGFRHALNLHVEMLAGALAEPELSSEQLLVLAGQISGICPASVLAQLLEHPACSLEVVATLALAERAHPHRLPRSLTDHIPGPLGPLDLLDSRGGALAAIARLSDQWEASAADLAAVAASVS